MVTRSDLRLLHMAAGVTQDEAETMDQAIGDFEARIRADEREKVLREAIEAIERAWEESAPVVSDCIDILEQLR